MLTRLNRDTFTPTVAGLDQGVLICFKKLCPHCKNMEKVLEKFAASRPDVPLFSLDSEEEPELMQSVGAERVPTLCIFRDGRVAAVKAGLMNPREFAAFYDSVSES